MSRHEIEIQISQEVAERHIENLVGFVTVGYDSPGYGYGEKDKKGVPIPKKMIGELAAKYDLPFLVDYASGLPVVGQSPQDLGADVGIWSMDKTARAPISGNMFLGPGLGTFDDNADLNEDYTRLGVKSLLRSVEIVCKYAGLSD